MGSEKFLIVNADDLGRSPGVNRGIFLAHERGIVTSASLMVRWPDAAAAVARGRAYPGLGLGLHVDLGEWSYRDGRWDSLYSVVSPDDLAAVAAETARQLDRFRSLVGRAPTHLDSHQNVHREEPVRSVLLEVAEELGVPLRFFRPGYHFFGGFYGQSADGSPLPDAIRVESLLSALGSLSPGVTELGCHPGLGGDVPGMYRAERAVEVETLCDPRVAAAVAEHGISLGSFADAEAFTRHAGWPVSSSAWPARSGASG